MDLDTIKQIIQDFFQETTVTIVGSGLSLAEGIPGMYDLSVELQSEIPSQLYEPTDVKIWNEIVVDLSAGVGLEQSLHNTKPSPHIGFLTARNSCRWYWIVVILTHLTKRQDLLYMYVN